MSLSASQKAVSGSQMAHQALRSPYYLTMLSEVPIRVLDGPTRHYEDHIRLSDGPVKLSDGAMRLSGYARRLSDALSGS
jgi:hypothetical protein